MARAGRQSQNRVKTREERNFGAGGRGRQSARLICRCTPPLTARACIPATGPFARLCIQFQGLSHRTFRSHVVAIVFFQPRGGLIYLKDDIIPSLGILIATVEAIPCTNSLNQQKHLPVPRKKYADIYLFRSYLTYLHVPKYQGS